MEDIANIRNLLTSAGLKVTHQRLVILGTVLDMDNHPSAEKIYNSLKSNHPSLSLATVYKTLETFVTKDLIKRVSTPEGYKRYDPNLANHGHIYCTKTGDIYDFYDEELDALIIDFFRKKKINNLVIKNITVQVNGEKADPSKDVTLK